LKIQIGDYVIGEKINEGSQARVYSGHNTKKTMQFAIKVYPKELAKKCNTFCSVKREIKIL